MPLTDAGKKTLANFRREYQKKGVSEKTATGYFYAYLNKHKEKRATYEGSKGK